LVKSFIHYQEIEPGFNADRLLMGMTVLPPSKYRDEARVTAFYSEFVSRVAALPGVSAAAASSEPPLAGGKMLTPVEPDGYSKTMDTKPPEVDYHGVTPAYFDVIGAPIRSGRSFNDRDDRSAPPVVIINQILAARLWPQAEALGHRMNFPELKKNACEVVGIVGDIRTESLTAEPCAQ